MQNDRVSGWFDMKIRFTNHAQIGMMERGISPTRVTDAIRKPDSRHSARDGATAYEKAFDSKMLRVICREQKKAEYVIITAYYL